jgi:hypothetical protein
MAHVTPILLITIIALAGYAIFLRRKVKTMSEQVEQLEAQLVLSEQETAETIVALEVKKAEVVAIQAENELLVAELATCKGDSVEKDAIIERAIASLSASNAALDAAQQ